MDQEVIDNINQNFEPEERALVIRALTSITLDHVMAQSEINLKNTRLSVLKLANGNVNDILKYTKCAKIDFRDVIMWAMKEE